ncbi:hypothetical protein Q5741_20215 [Paenibacillus sp. JX-17]|uniref:YetF C-terminal domain-containing protein n=1 Tax=Paenibacillus lacisoli TaxID=3064525 RepID=A0ABT9CHF5_9BACL|nr:YetF domain-containing protein [Paenibacillus sp. JX-17]MDO7908714.1 hypothetical protein [Paenibacillus sp. JX-17]
MTAASRGLPHSFIVDGQLIEPSLRHLNKDHQWVNELLKQHGVNQIRDIALAQIDQNGKLYIEKNPSRESDTSSTPH